MATSSGRRFTKITATAVNSITVEDSFNITLAGAVDCACGGKRSAITTARIFDDIKGVTGSEVNGWTVQIENTGANYVIASTLVVAATVVAGAHIQGTGSPRPIIESTANVTSFQPRNADVSHITFINTSGAKATAFAITFSGAALSKIHDCIFGGTSLAQGFQSAFTSGATVGNGGNVWDNEIRFNVIGYNGIHAALRFAWNYVHDNGTGIEEASCGNVLNCAGTYYRNLIVNNTGDGVRSNSVNPAHFIENVVDGNGGDGFDFGSFGHGKSLIGNQITNNTGFAVNCTAASVACPVGGDRVAVGIQAFNNLFNNTGGTLNNWPTGDSQTTINPGYIDRPGFNWCVSSGAGNRGGPPGSGEFVFGSATGSFLLRGACQAAGAGAGANIGI
jgi:hypothetical protein